MNDKRTILISAGILGATGVALSAFAAHGLRDILPPDRLDVFKTGAQYQILHALALLALANLSLGKYGSWIAKLFVAGTALFSGSLYVLAASGVKWLGAITPLGGVCYIAGWSLIAFASMKQETNA